MFVPLLAFAAYLFVIVGFEVVTKIYENKKKGKK